MLCRDRKLAAGTGAAAPQLCALGQSRHCFLLVWPQPERAFPSFTGTVPSAAWGSELFLHLAFHVYDEEMLPHLKGAVGGEVHPDVGREKLRAAGGETRSICMPLSTVAAGTPGYSCFWQISFYTSAGGLKTVTERS